MTTTPVISPMRRKSVISLIHSPRRLLATVMPFSKPIQSKDLRNLAEQLTDEMSSLKKRRPALQPKRHCRGSELQIMPRSLDRVAGRLYGRRIIHVGSRSDWRITFQPSENLDVVETIEVLALRINPI